jgi:hypothetical protein
MILLANPKTLLIFHQLSQSDQEKEIPEHVLHLVLMSLWSSLVRDSSSAFNPGPMLARQALFHLSHSLQPLTHISWKTIGQLFCCMSFNLSLTCVLITFRFCIFGRNITAVTFVLFSVHGIKRYIMSLVILMWLLEERAGLPGFYTVKSLLFPFHPSPFLHC